LTKRTSINSIRKFHKEKEMADFRKWLIAFAAVALLLSLGSTSANAQVTTNPAFNCVANAGVPPLVRAEGVAELVGDLILNCTGGNPTLAGVPIPQSNVQVFLNTNLTSRLYANNVSEALLIIDEPFSPTPNPVVVPPAGAATHLLGCLAVNSVNCAILGTGGGTGAAGPYTGVNGRYNVFQGLQNFPTSSGINTVAWLGVPIDAPGTTGTRVIRITNVRANACLLGAGSSLIPQGISMFIAVNGSQQVTINNPTQTVAFIRQGLITAPPTPALFVQCININGELIDPTQPIGQGGPDSPILINAVEGFASSFKVRNYAQIQLGSPAAPVPPTNVALQNVVGFPYNTESGYVNDAVPTGAFGPNGTATGAQGLADQGTQIAYTFTNIGAGISIYVPPRINLVSTIDGTVTGAAILAGQTANATALVPISLTAGTGAAVYEVWFDNPNVIESAQLPVFVAAISNTTNNLPAIGKGSVSVNFAPLAGSTAQVASPEPVPIPRFCQPYPVNPLFSIAACTCNLLFPFVTQQNGFDTGVAIANTSMDPYGTALQHGTITLNYFGNTTGGGAAPAPQTSTDVAAGDELVFSLFGGDASGHGITPTPGFQGYVIAVANFQYCHGFAFISDLGAQKLAEGYLAIEIDEPFNIGGDAVGFSRTGVAGEVQAH
jgi:hypothetical protein